MKVEEYLKKCKVRSVNELTDEQVVDYFIKRLAPKNSVVSVERAVNGWCGIPPQKEKALPLMREALSTGKRFVAHITDIGEGGEGKSGMSFSLSDY